jgi:hypothetical protein
MLWWVAIYIFLAKNHQKVTHLVRISHLAFEMCLFFQERKFLFITRPPNTFKFFQEGFMYKVMSKEHGILETNTH